MISNLRLPVWAVLAAFLTAPALGQDGDTFIKDLQAKSVLSDEERNQLKEWVQQRVLAVAESSNQAGSELRSAYAGSGGFREAYTKVCVDVIAPVYGRSNLSLIASTQLVSLLGAMNDMQVHDTLVKALGDKRVAVRTAAAAGLGRLRPQIARTGSAKVNETMTALQTAGSKENSAVALKTIYRALDFQGIPSPTEAAGNRRSLLALLKARQGQYASSKSETPAWGAEIAGLKLAGRLVRGMSEPEKTQLAEATGQILLIAVVRYADDLYEIADASEGGSALDIAIRNETEILIQTCESILGQTLNAGSNAPNISAQMQNLEPVNMKLEMKKWAKLLQPKTGKDFDPDNL